MKSSSVLHFLLGAVLLATLSACNSHSPSATISSADNAPLHKRVAASRGETVFRLQNLVMDDLITAQMTNPSLLAADRINLASFESRLVDTCSSLNEAADTSATGSEPGMMLKFRVMFAMAGCEQSAIAAQTFMASDPPLLGASLP